MPDNSDILCALENGLPLVPHPFDELAHELSTDESRVVAFVQGLFHTGKARRLGAVFDARRLGYRSALCAVRIDDPVAATGVGETVSQIPGVTHCYERGWPEGVDTSLPGGPSGATLPNLWFTFAVLQDRFDAGIDDIREMVAPHSLLVLPARSRFKIDLVFDPRTRDRDERFPGAAEAPGDDRIVDESPAELSDMDRQIVRRFQGSLDPVANVYARAAGQLGLETNDLLARLRHWHEAGVLRRIALFMRRPHGRARTSGMCVWRVAPDDVGRVGRALAEHPQVAHCYERAMEREFPFNVFAMIQTPAWASSCELFRRLCDIVGMTDGRVLFSVRQFKKAGMRYFQEGSDSET